MAELHNFCRVSLYNINEVFGKVSEVRCKSPTEVWLSKWQTIRPIYPLYTFRRSNWHMLKIVGQKEQQKIYVAVHNVGILMLWLILIHFVL